MTVQKDKVLHLLAGWVITVLVGYFTYHIVGIFATLIIAGLKEKYDGRYPEKHTVDGWDAYATTLGIIPGSITLMYMDKILRTIHQYL